MSVLCCDVIQFRLVVFLMASNGWVIHQHSRYSYSASRQVNSKGFFISKHIAPSLKQAPVSGMEIKKYTMYGLHIALGPQHSLVCQFDNKIVGCVWKEPRNSAHFYFKLCKCAVSYAALRWTFKKASI